LNFWEETEKKMTAGAVKKGGAYGEAARRAKGDGCFHRRSPGTSQPVEKKLTKGKKKVKTHMYSEEKGWEGFLHRRSSPGGGKFHKKCSRRLGQRGKGRG